jgi:hypothetical protein
VAAFFDLELHLLSHVNLDLPQLRLQIAVPHANAENFTNTGNPEIGCNPSCLRTRDLKAWNQREKEQEEKMGSVVLPHLRTGWHVDQAILSEEDRLVVIRFGRDSDPDCMRQDEVLFKIADKVKNFAVSALSEVLTYFATF